MLVIFIAGTVYPQGLFENAVSGNESGEINYKLSGNFRSDIFADEKEIKNLYAEAAFMFDVHGNQLGNAFAELRCRGSNTDENSELFRLREGYINLRLNQFNFRVGEQIIVWGRADGFNPTNNLTPVDYTVYSPDEDEKRLANFAVQSVCHLYPVRIEFDWVPVHGSSILPFENTELPDNVSWTEDGDLSPDWKNSSFGLKIDIEKPAFDASVSYFYGYHKLPGILYAGYDNGYGIYTKPYRTQVIGVDFSTVVGSYGLRGEFAYSIPDQTPDELLSIPYKQLEYTFGIDSEWGNLSLILQYVGKYIPDLELRGSTSNYLINEIIKWNRIIFSQHEKWNHSISLRPSVNLLYETLKLELLGLTNLSTGDAYFQPKAVYELADAYELSFGVQLYYGPDYTLYGFLEKSRNSCFAELKISF